MSLRARRADTAPAGPPGEECAWLRAPLPVHHDADLSDGAKVLYNEIVWQCHNDRQPLTTATNAELGHALGKTERQIRRLLRELEGRGHVTTAPVQCMANSPRGVTPVHNPRRPRVPEGLQRGGTFLSPPGGTKMSGREDAGVRPGGQECPPGRTPASGPLLEIERKRDSERPGIAARGDQERFPRQNYNPLPPPEPEPDPETLDAEAEAMERQAAGATDRVLQRLYAASARRARERAQKGRGSPTGQGNDPRPPTRH